MGTVRKLIVEVVDAHNLAPKDGHGTSSPYVVVDFYGQRRKTRTAVRDLNPVWNETLSFNVGPHNDIFGDVLELAVYHDQKLDVIRRGNSLGQIRLSSTQFVRKGEEALIYYELKKKNLFNIVQGNVGLRIYYVDEEEVLPKETPKTEEAKPEPGDDVSMFLKEKETKSSDEHDKVEEQPPAEDVEELAEKGKPEVEKPSEPELEKPSEPEPELQQPDQSTDRVDALPAEPCVMAAAASISRSVSEIRFNNGINGPQPMRRSASTASFTSEASTE